MPVMIINLLLFITLYYFIIIKQAYQYNGNYEVEQHHEYQQ